MAVALRLAALLQLVTPEDPVAANTHLEQILLARLSIDADRQVQSYSRVCQQSPDLHQVEATITA